jgi:hypothetical protein
LPWASQVEIRGVDTDRLRNAGTCPSQEEKQGVVPAPKGPLPIWRIQEGINFGRRQIARSLEYGAFQGNFKDSLGQGQRSRIARGDVPKEGSNRGEPGISRTRPIPSTSLKVLKKAQNDFAVQVGHLELTWLATGPFGGVEDEKPQGIPVGCRGQRADVALLEESLPKERLQQGREVRSSVHDTPPSFPKARAAARPSNSGVPVT